MASEIVALQAAEGPSAPGIQSGTDLLLPAVTSDKRFAHFPEEVYDLSAESHLVRFLKVLTGDSGAGQLRKRMIAARLQRSLQGSHFYDLDRFYGALFGVRRSAEEILDLDPYTENATSEQWVVQQAKDASYRSRVSQFARALNYGPTPTGIELVAEALLSVDCDVYESFIQADGSFRTVDEIELLYGLGDTSGRFFSGDTPKIGDLEHGWLGAANGSASVESVQGLVLRTNLASNPLPTGAGSLWAFQPGPGGAVGAVAYNTTSGDGPEGSTGFIRRTITTVKTSGNSGHYYIEPSTLLAGVAGDQRRASMWVRFSTAVTVVGSLTFYTSASVAVGNALSTPVAVPANTWTQITVEATATGTYDRVQYYVRTDNVTPVGTTYDATRILIESSIPSAGTIDAMEDVPLSVLEGEGLNRLSGDERRVFVVRPKRAISQAEAYEVGRVLQRIKPADARFIIDFSGTDPYKPVTLRGAVADSAYWEIVPKVATRQVAGSPYQVESLTPVEQPRPAFTSYQGEAWSYLSDVIGVAAFYGEPIVDAPAQRVTLPDGSHLDYPAYQAMTPRRHILAGRSASDGVLTTSPYWRPSSADSTGLAPLLVDRMNLDDLNTLLDSSPLDTLPQNPSERFWASAVRPKTDQTPEVLEVSLAHPRRVNYVAVDVARYPHQIILEAYSEGQWRHIDTRFVMDSVPQYLPPGQQVLGHPQHSHPGHWLRQSFNFTESVTTNALRMTLVRIDGPAPRASATTEVPYSLALRSLDVGYRVRSLDDVPVDTDVRDGVAPIGASLDVVGSSVEYYLRQEAPSQALVKGVTTVWRSEPQPVNYAVVNFYLDVRDDEGDAQVIDRFFMNPTHSGAHMSIYWTEAVLEGDSQASTLRNRASRTRGTNRVLSNGGGLVANDNVLTGGPDDGAWRRSTITTAPGDGGGAFSSWIIDPSAESAPVTPGETITISVDQIVSRAIGSVGLQVQFFNSSGGLVSGGVSSYQGAPPVAGQWFHLSRTITVPANAASIQVGARWTVIPSLVEVGDWWGFSRVMMVDGDQDVPFFDGDTPAGDDTTYSWDGFPGFSTSLRTYNPADTTADEEWYERQVWRPIARDYTLQKGYVFIPPTYARHFKFEFTSLSAEQHESLVPLVRKVRLFPQYLIDRMATESAGEEILPSGLRTAIEIGDNDAYADALTTLRIEATNSTTYDATEALYVDSPLGAERLRDQSWVYGFTPWHQGTNAPRFTRVEQHVYEVIEIRQTTTVGFFVGLTEIRAYRLDPGADDDTQIYDEYFHDFRHLQPGFSWTFTQNALTSELSSDVSVQSSVHTSKHDVSAIQFATQQTDPVQVVPDDDLRDPLLAGIDWSDNDEGWHRYGDAVTVYSPQNHSARIARYARPLLRPVQRSGGLVQGVVQPVFSYRPIQTQSAWAGERRNLVVNPSLEAAVLQGTVVRRNLATRALPTAVATPWSYYPGSSGIVVSTSADTTASAGPEGRTGFLHAAVTTAGATNSSHGWRFEQAVGRQYTPGSTLSVSVWVRFSVTIPAATARFLNIDALQGSTQVFQQQASGFIGDIPANTWVQMTNRITSPYWFDGIRANILLGSAAASVLPVGGTFDVSSILIEEGSALLPFFDGSTADTSLYDYSWEGASGTSISRATATAVRVRRNFALNPQATGTPVDYPNVPGSTRLPFFGIFFAAGGDEATVDTSATGGPSEVASFVRHTITTKGTHATQRGYWGNNPNLDPIPYAGLAGERCSLSMWVRYTGAAPAQFTLTVKAYAGAIPVSGATYPEVLTLNPGEWTRMAASLQGDSPWSLVLWDLKPTDHLEVGDTVSLTGLLVEPGVEPRSYFDPTMTIAGVTTAWDGIAAASPSSIYSPLGSTAAAWYPGTGAAFAERSTEISAPSRTYIGKVTADGSDPDYATVASGTILAGQGVRYTLSTQVRVPSASDVVIRTRYVDSQGNPLASGPEVVRAVAADTWTRMSMIFTAQDNRLVVEIGLKGAAEGDSCFFDSVLLEASETLQDYFDGSTTGPVDGGDYSWEGVADLSQSVFTPPDPIGGIETPQVGVSDTGVIYAAVRMTYLTEPESPAWVQVVDGSTRALIGEHEIVAPANTAIEQYYPFTLNGAESVRVRVVQKGASDDTFEVDRLSLFDVGIQWEFSVNGGTDWVQAEGVRNNANGIVSFPEPGNQLVWRARGRRPRMTINALRIRPRYLGVQNARNNGEQRGPNVSSYDAAVPVNQDPMFTTWPGPIPRDWFLAYRQFPLLVLAEGPNVTEFARFYGRPIDEVLDEPSDVATRSILIVRRAADSGWKDDGSGPTSDDAVRVLSAFRGGSDVVPEPTDVAFALILAEGGTGIVEPPVHPV